MGEEKKKSHGFLAFAKSKGRLWLLLGGAVLGVLLLLFGSMSDREVSEESEDTLSARAAELEAYEVRLESEVRELCEAVSGVGDCEVMITFAHGYEIVYTVDENKNPVTVGNGSSEEALFDTVTPPAVAGVGVVCRGGNDAYVREALTELVSTALGISSNRVYITGK